MKVIPIVFATNNEYIPYLGVAIKSLILWSEKKNQYNIFVLHDSVLEKNQRRIIGMNTSNINIEFIDVSALSSEIHIKLTHHYSVETTFRLLIPEIFKQYQKVIYLDCDLVLQKDVVDLYQVDLGDNLVAAVEHTLDDYTKDYYMKLLNTADTQFFNAGVLLINNELFRRENIMEKCIFLLNGESGKKYEFLDQDVLNIVCNKRIKWLDDRWNYAWQFMWSDITPEYVQRYRETALDPYIFHFTSYRKPWNIPEEEMADIFWKYARTTPFYEEILLKSMDWKRTECFKRHLFPFHLVQKNKTVMIYGAGNVGQKFIKQLEITGYARVSKWIDRDFEKYRKIGFMVSDISEINNTDFDYLVIAIEKESIAMEIKNWLQDDKKVRPETIIWDRYLF